MRLDEAKDILKENGYELLEEGFVTDIFKKISKQISLVALFMGLITSTAQAVDLKDCWGKGKKFETEQELKESFAEFVQNRNSVKCFIKKHGVVCKHDELVNFYNTSKVKGFDENTVQIDFDLHYSDESGNLHNVMVIEKDDGYIITYFSNEDRFIFKSY